MKQPSRAHKTGVRFQWAVKHARINTTRIFHSNPLKRPSRCFSRLSARQGQHRRTRREERNKRDGPHLPEEPDGHARHEKFG